MRGRALAIVPRPADLARVLRLDPADAACIPCARLRVAPVRPAGVPVTGSVPAADPAHRCWNHLRGMPHGRPSAQADRIAVLDSAMSHAA